MLHCNVIEDPEEFKTWFLANVPSDTGFETDDDFAMVKSLHEWLATQQTTISCARDLIGGLLADPPTMVKVIVVLAHNAFMDFRLSEFIEGRTYDEDPD